MVDTSMFEDPVTLEVMHDAVVTKCGHSFSQSSLSSWLRTKNTCPVCKQECRMDECTPNYALRHVIEQCSSGSSNPLPAPPLTLSSSVSGGSMSNISGSMSNLAAVARPENEIAIIKEIRKEHIERASVVMEHAFRTGPNTLYTFPGPATDRSIKGMAWVFLKELEYAVQNGRVWGAYDAKNPHVLVGVALWQPPYDSGVSYWQMIKSGLVSAPWVMGIKPAWRTVAYFDLTERKHRETITAPHWGLYAIGVEPAFQSKGIGTKLMKPILDCADDAGTPCYVDTANERSVNFFRRLGFEVVLNVDCSPSPPFWTMVRQPQATPQ